MTTFIIMTFSKMNLFTICSIKKTLSISVQYRYKSVVMLSVAFFIIMLSVVMLSTIMQNVVFFIIILVVVMLSAILLNVNEPMREGVCNRKYTKLCGHGPVQ
jgi:hypothetical protein